jgi:hypothetical protein
MPQVAVLTTALKTAVFNDASKGRETRVDELRRARPA